MGSRRGRGANIHTPHLFNHHNNREVAESLDPARAACTSSTIYSCPILSFSALPLFLFQHIRARHAASKVHQRTLHTSWMCQGRYEHFRCGHAVAVVIVKCQKAEDCGLTFKQCNKQSISRPKKSEENCEDCSPRKKEEDEATYVDKKTVEEKTRCRLSSREEEKCRPAVPHQPVWKDQPLPADTRHPQLRTSQPAILRQPAPRHMHGDRLALADHLPPPHTDAQKTSKLKVPSPKMEARKEPYTSPAAKSPRMDPRVGQRRYPHPSARHPAVEPIVVQSPYPRTATKDQIVDPPKVEPRKCTSPGIRIRANKTSNMVASSKGMRKWIYPREGFR